MSNEAVRGWCPSYRFRIENGLNLTIYPSEGDITPNQMPKTEPVFVIPEEWAKENLSAPSLARLYQIGTPEEPETD